MQTIQLRGSNSKIFAYVKICETTWTIRVIDPTNLEAIDIMNIEHGRKFFKKFKKIQEICIEVSRIVRLS